MGLLKAGEQQLARRFVLPAIRTGVEFETILRQVYQKRGPRRPPDNQAQSLDMTPTPRISQKNL